MLSPLGHPYFAGSILFYFRLPKNKNPFLKTIVTGFAIFLKSKCKTVLIVADVFQETGCNTSTMIAFFPVYYSIYTLGSNFCVLYAFSWPGSSTEFSHSRDVHSCNTRHRDLLRLPLARTTKYEGSFRFSGAKIWNTVRFI